MTVSLGSLKQISVWKISLQIHARQIRWMMSCSSAFVTKQCLDKVSSGNRVTEFHTNSLQTPTAAVVCSVLCVGNRKRDELESEPDAPGNSDCSELPFGTPSFLLWQ